MLMDALLDEDIKLVTCTGKAGTGKTLVSIAMALYRLLEKTTSTSGCLSLVRWFISVRIRGRFPVLWKRRWLLTLRRFMTIWRCFSVIENWLLRKNR